MPEEKPERKPAQGPTRKASLVEIRKRVREGPPKATRQASLEELEHARRRA